MNLRKPKTKCKVHHVISDVIEDGKNLDLFSYTALFFPSFKKEGFF